LISALPLSQQQRSTPPTALFFSFLYTFFLVFVRCVIPFSMDQLHFASNEEFAESLKPTKAVNFCQWQHSGSHRAPVGEKYCSRHRDIQDPQTQLNRALSRESTKMMKSKERLERQNEETRTAKRRFEQIAVELSARKMSTAAQLVPAAMNMSKLLKSVKESGIIPQAQNVQNVNVNVINVPHTSSAGTPQNAPAQAAAPARSAASPIVSAVAPASAPQSSLRALSSADAQPMDTTGARSTIAQPLRSQLSSLNIQYDLPALETSSPFQIGSAGPAVARRRSLHSADRCYIRAPDHTFKREV